MVVLGVEASLLSMDNRRIWKVAFSETEWHETCVIQRMILFSEEMNAVSPTHRSSRMSRCWLVLGLFGATSLFTGCSLVHHSLVESQKQDLRDAHMRGDITSQELSERTDQVEQTSWEWKKDREENGGF